MSQGHAGSTCAVAAMKKKEQREACLKELEGRQTAQLPVRLRAWDSTGGGQLANLKILGGGDHPP